MSDGQIVDAIDRFGEAAARAVTIAGFDGGEVHGANGYIVDQFLPDYTNRRTDRWGGDTHARTEVTVAALRAIRAAVGPDVPVGVRMRGGERDAETIFGNIADAGVDYIHVTEFEAWQPAFASAGPTLAHLAHTCAPGRVIVANGNLHQPGRAAAVLADGADMVAIGRVALSDPDFPARHAAGLPMHAFDPALLQPIADVKASELAR